MTSPLLAPRRARVVPVATKAAFADGSTSTTRVLDWKSPAVAGFDADVGVREAIQDQEWLRAAHAAIAARIRPVYALNELQPTSRTVERGRGSCSQRLAVLESLARRRGIRTRVEGIVVDGRFWYPRFRRTRWLVPDRVVLAWPEFELSARWVAVGELFDTAPASGDFTNASEETLFDAVGRTGVAWGGDCAENVCDLSGHVLDTLGYFDHRDELFARYGQTLCLTARTLGDPFMSRRSSRSRTR